MCRLQTIPDDYAIIGGRTAAQRQLGNAVPSLLTEILGREIRKQLLREEMPMARPQLLPPDRSPPPRPHRLRPVAKKYMQYEGQHAPHPGEGQGRRANARAPA